MLSMNLHDTFYIPSGELTFCHGKSPFFMGNPLEMAILHTFYSGHCGRLFCWSSTSTCSCSWCSCRCSSVQVHRGRSVALFPGPTQSLGVKRKKRFFMRQFENQLKHWRLSICRKNISQAFFIRGDVGLARKSLGILIFRAEECRIAFPTC